MVSSKPLDVIGSLDFRYALQKVSNYGCVVDSFVSKSMFEILKILDYWSYEIQQATTFLMIFVRFHRNFISFYV